MEEMICPSCGLPSADGYCMNCLSAIPEPMPEPEPEPEEDGSQQSDCQANQAESDAHGGHDPQENQSANEQKVTCPTCGAQGSPGRECIQCGDMLPMVKTSVQASCGTEREISSARLVMPNGRGIGLCDGKSYVIGRESPDRSISEALSGWKNVSRCHCVIRADFANAKVFVRDERSMNGTYVGEDSPSYRVSAQEEFPLPARIWLGKKTSIRIDI